MRQTAASCAALLDVAVASPSASLVDRFEAVSSDFRTILEEVCSRAAASSVSIRVTGGSEGATFTGYRPATEPGSEALGRRPRSRQHVDQP